MQSNPYLAPNDTDLFLFNAIYQPGRVPTEILNISPTSGPQAGGTSVTITGSNFKTGATVLFGAVAATSVVVVHPSLITCATPAAGGSTVSVTVTNTDGSSGVLTNAYNFSNYNPSLVTSGVTPASGGTTVTLNTTGATLLVAVLSGNTGGSAPTMSDAVGGNSNAWNYLTTATQTDGNRVRIAYAYAATGGGALNVGASHVFTPAGTSFPTTVSCGVYVSVVRQPMQQY